MAAEPPIYIGYAHHGDYYNYLDSGIPVERRPLRTGEVWADYDSIPPAPPAPAPFPGSVGVFTNGILNEPLVATASPLEFATSPSGRMALILPGNILNQAYRPVLRDATAREIPYDPSIWVADGIEEVVCFKEKTPAALGYRLPLSMTYWVYTGGVAGTSVGLGGLTNEGGGAGVYDMVIANIAHLRSLLGTGNGLTVTQNPSTITIDNTLTGANLGGGTPLFAAKVGAALQFNSLSGTANGLVIAGPAGGLITVDNTLTGVNLGAGSQLFASKVADLLNFRSLIAAASSGLTLAQNANDLTLSASAGTAVTIANEGAGTGLVFDAVVANQANLRTLQNDPLAANAGIAVATVGQVINIGNTLTGTNLGGGASVFAAKVGAALQFNSLDVTVNGLAISGPAGGLITIDNTLTAANLGAGSQLFSTKTTNLLNFRSLLGTANGLTVTQAATTITIDNTLTGANVGAGTGTVFSAKSGAALQFNSFAGTTNGLTVSAPVANLITIDNTLTGNNLGAGSQLFSTKTTNLLNFRSLLGTANGLTVTQAATTITIDNTLTGANVGAGTGTVFSAKSGAVLQFNSFAGTVNGLTVSAPAANLITIDNTLTGNNLGAGSQLFSTKTTNLLNFRSLLGTANGLTVTQAATTITIDNTLTGSNLGAGTGTVFSAKSGAALQFNSFAGTANGLTVSAPVANLITIDNTLTGTNIGVGPAQVFSNKLAASLRFRTLNASNGVAVNQSGDNITFTLSQTSWRLYDLKASGTAGGATPANAAVTRTLNTIESSGPNSAFVTLAANRVDFAAGRYAIVFQAPADSVAHHCYLNYFLDAVVVVGTNVASSGEASISSGYDVAAGPTSLFLVHYVNAVPVAPFTALALGHPVTQAGVSEVYSQILITYLGP